MTDAERSPALEDLEVDAAEADSVRGGITHKQRRAMIARLEKHGWVRGECEPAGDVFTNPKTHQTKIVPYAH